MCHNCSSNDHSFRNCPFKSPNKNGEPWKVRAFARETTQEGSPFECQVRLHGGKTLAVCSKTVQEFWNDIQVGHGQSIYRDFVGIRKQGMHMILPPGTTRVEPGTYTLVSRTHYLSDEALDATIQGAVAKLNELRPLLSKDVLRRLEEELLLRYNHFTLVHEGNGLKLDETRLLSEILASRDWKHEADDEDEARKVSDSKDDVTEAINHIVVSQDLQETAQHDVTEDMVLDLHSRVMKDLLHEEAEGLPGTYRKVKVCVSGSKVQREHPDLIEHSMEMFFDDTLCRHESESIFDFLARFHTEFQYIRPFRDGNGRIGRILMNIFLIKQGYPVLVLPSTLSALFNHAVGLGIHGLEHQLENGEKLLSRLLAEAVFSSLQAYENAIGEPLLPSVEDILGAENVHFLPAPPVIPP